MELEQRGPRRSCPPAGAEAAGAMGLDIKGPIDVTDVLILSKETRAVWRLCG